MQATDIRRHPMYSLVSAFVRHVDRTRFRVSLYHVKSDATALQALLPFVHADHSVDDAMSDAELARHIRAAGATVLLDAAGALLTRVFVCHGVCADCDARRNPWRAPGRGHVPSPVSGANALGRLPGHDGQRRVPLHCRRQLHSSSRGAQVKRSRRCA